VSEHVIDEWEDSENVKFHVVGNEPGFVEVGVSNYAWVPGGKASFSLFSVFDCRRLAVAILKGAEIRWGDNAKRPPTKPIRLLEAAGILRLSCARTKQMALDGYLRIYREPGAPKSGVRAAMWFDREDVETAAALLDQLRACTGAKKKGSVPVPPSAEDA
jgi:hypothetical protein